MATDRLGSIAAFVRVAEQGSFASAGRVSGLSASAVSKSVMRLEARLGLRLFQRTTRMLALTADGAAFHARCVAILADLDAAEHDMRDRADRPTGLLRIELPTALGRIKIVPALHRLTARYPDLQVEATFDDALSDPIAKGLDAVVRIGEPRDNRLIVRRVGTIRYVVCGAPDYLTRASPPATPSDLDSHACVRRVELKGGNAPWRFADPITGAPFERDVAGVLSLGSNDAIVDAALAGAGLVQLHEYMAEPHLRSGALMQVLAEYAVDAWPISVLFPSTRRLSPKVRAFVDFAVATLQ